MRAPGSGAQQPKHTAGFGPSVEAAEAVTGAAIAAKKIAPATKNPCASASRQSSVSLDQRRCARWLRCQPIEPTISSWISLLSSTAYSIGSSLVTGSMKPLTIIAAASSSVKPREPM